MFPLQGNVSAKALAPFPMVCYMAAAVHAL